MDRSLAGGASLGGLSRPRRPPPERRAARARAPQRARGPRETPARTAASAESRLAAALLEILVLARRFAVAVWARRRVRLLLLALVLLAPLLVGGFRWLRHSSLVAVRQVRISGVSGPQASAIEAALTRAARRMSTLDVHVSALRAAVAPFHVVSAVKASAGFPHALHIRVSEQLPVAALLAGGTRTAVAANGMVLGPALLSGALPTVGARSVPALGQRVRDGSLAAVLDALGAAPARLASTVTGAFSGSRGVTLVFRSGLRAYFGDAGRPHAKWLALALVLAREHPAGAVYVDVRVPERPAVGFGPGGAPPAQSTSSSSASSSATVATGTPESIAEGIAAGLGQAEASSGASSQEQRGGTTSEGGTGAEGGAGAGSQAAAGAGSEAGGRASAGR
jgi:cell division protein FtsQ